MSETKDFIHNLKVRVHEASGRIPDFKKIAVNAYYLVEIQRRQDLITHNKNKRPDVILVGEPKLNIYYEFYIENYTIIKSDRYNNKGGGTVIIMRHNIEFQKVEIRGRANLIILESTVVKNSKK